MRILLVPSRGQHSASSRLRVYGYLPLWRREGVHADLAAWPSGSGDLKRRALEDLCSCAPRYDLVFLHRVLPHRRWLAKIRAAARILVFDFDDAMYSLTSPQLAAARRPTVRAWAGRLWRRLTRGGPFFSGRKKRLDAMLAVADGIVAGNRTLADYCARFLRPTCVVPTPVDVEELPVSGPRPAPPVVIAWVGHRHGLEYLENIRPALEQIGNRYGSGVVLRLCTQANAPRFKALPVEVVPWSPGVEDSVLAAAHIGIMPLSDDEWSRGKCAHKALKYMGAGLPTVLSPVGMNRDIVQDGQTGFFASTPEEWVAKLSRLIEDEALRASMGLAARGTVEQSFARPVVFSRLYEFCRRLCSVRAPTPVVSR